MASSTSPSSPSPPRRLSADSRREQIMRAAAGLFTERGFEGVSMADIAQALRTSRPTIYTYFPSTESVLEALLDERLAQLPERLRPHLGGQRASFRNLLLALLQEKELLRLLNSGGGPLFRRRRQAFLKALEDRLELRQLGREKASALGRAPQPLLIPILLHLLSSVAFEHVSGEPEADPEALAELLDTFIQGGLEAVFRRQSAQEDRA